MQLNQHQFTIGVMVGCVLIVCGLVPGLFEWITEEILNFRDSLFSPYSSPRRLQVEIRQPTWLAGLGTVIIAATVLEFISK